MSQANSTIATLNSKLSRRSILAAIPATAILAACGPSSPGSLGEDSFTSASGSGAAVDHSAWDAVLREYLVESEDGVNRVRYNELKDEAADALTAYLDAMQAVAIEDFGRDEQFAFWVNLSLIHI